MWNWIRVLLDAIVAKLPAPLRKLWQFLSDFKDKFLTLFERVHTLVSSVQDEVHQIINFQFNPQWRTRVISAPVAIDKIQEFFQAFPDILDQIKSLASEIRQKINVPETTFNADELEGLESFRRLPAKLVQIGEKLVAWAGLILDALNTISDAVDQLQRIVNDVRTIRESIENLDAIFLPQNKPKKLVDVKYRKRGG
jgi:signal transduction histidine kinase